MTSATKDSYRSDRCLSVDAISVGQSSFLCNTIIYLAELPIPRSTIVGSRLGGKENSSPFEDETGFVWEFDLLQSSYHSVSNL